MKHTLKVTIALVLFFFVAQIMGLLIVNQYIDHKKTVETKAVQWQPLPYNLERPQVENESLSFLFVLIPILIGTFLVLVIIKFNKAYILKIMFFIAIFTSLSIAFSAFINSFVAAALALLITIVRLFKPNFFIQNFSEIFIYGGVATIFVSIFNLLAVSVFLILISIYDYIAVFKTKHMITLANFQSQSKIFAGLSIPYDRKKLVMKPKVIAELNIGKKSQTRATKKSVAVLGGGDIGFTLIFAGVVMKELMLQETMLIGFLKTLIIPVIVSLALLMLLLKGQKDKFYPAMPVLSIGCFIGYLVVLVI